MEPHNQRLSWRLAVVLCAAVLVAVFGGVTPASATVVGPCGENSSAGLLYCSFQNDARTERVFVELKVEAGFSGIIYSQVSRFNATAGATVFVQQCDGFGHNCSTMSANNGKSVYMVQTSNKPGGPGHSFRTCASWTTTTGWHEVNRCSPYSSV